MSAPAVPSTDGEPKDDLVLAVIIPEGSKEGETFHVSLEQRYFEVTTPPGVKSGDTINIIVRNVAEDEGGFKSVQDVGAAVASGAKAVVEKAGLTERAQRIDESYKVTERAKSALNSAQAFDTQYAISSRVNKILASLDSKLQLSNRAIRAEDAIIAFAREIDARLAVSATSARVVVSGANMILSAYKRALLLDEKMSISSTASRVVSKALEYSGMAKHASVPPAVTDENAKGSTTETSRGH